MTTRAPRLTIHDQLLINLCGWVACLRLKPEANYQLMIDQLRRTIPNVNHDNPLIGPLALAALKVVESAEDWRSVTHCLAVFELSCALVPVFMHRAAQCCATIWPEENRPDTLPAEEPAHAAE